MRVEGRDTDEWMAVKLGQRKQYTISLSSTVCVFTYVAHTYKFAF